MCIRKIFFLIYLVQAASSCFDKTLLKYSLTTTILDKEVIQQTIDYCDGDPFSLTCEYDTEYNTTNDLYFYTLYKCSDITCSHYKRIETRDEPSSVYSEMLLDPSYNNNVYGCGIIHYSEVPKTYIGSKIYVLKLIETSPRTTSITVKTTATTMFPTNAADSAEYKTTNDGGSVWAMVGYFACGILVSALIAVAAWLFYKFRAKRCSGGQVRNSYRTSPEDQNIYAEVYEVRRKLEQQARQCLESKEAGRQLRPPPPPIGTIPVERNPARSVANVRRYSMLTPASDMYLLQIDSEGYQIPELVQMGGIQHDMNVAN